MKEKEEALYFFRKLVYVLYLEIGSLQYRVHPALAEKARLNTSFFQREKARQAAALYHQVENEEDPAKILMPFEERTGLRLEEVLQAFTEGDWKNKFGGYTVGGPRWARIAELTIELRRQIDLEAWEEAANLIYEIKGLKTNQGYLVNQFERTERRR